MGQNYLYYSLSFVLGTFVLCSLKTNQFNHVEVFKASMKSAVCAGVSLETSGLVLQHQLLLFVC